MNINAIAVKNLLSPEITERLQQSIEEHAMKQADTFVGLWDKQTGFCVVLEFWSGKPSRWHFAGPFDDADAREWLGVIRSAISTALH